LPFTIAAADDLGRETTIERGDRLALRLLALGAGLCVGLTAAAVAKDARKEVGTASWYGPQLHGERTASGEIFDRHAYTAAHPSLPLNSVVKVTNLANGRSVVLRVNDRLPKRDRVIDVSQRAAEELGMKRRGLAKVRIELLPF
jgi:rare lipoprotein A (peptidoglycan hydrolase)